MTFNIVLSLVLIASFMAYWTESWFLVMLLILLVILLIFMMQFFRNPDRSVVALDDDKVLSPADGKVVVIEEVEDPETNVGKRVQVSIFMSPLNVHVNRIPISGVVSYFKYHPGKYLVAWNPKSSTENERTTYVLDTPHGKVVLRQIAGAVARRICSYHGVGDKVEQGEELGFIKFGSRCDILLPPDTNIVVSIGDQVKGNLDVIATFDRSD
jgi:phosphatidylserine decarboxylase